MHTGKISILMLGLFIALCLQVTLGQLKDSASPKDSQFRKDFSQLRFPPEGTVTLVTDPTFPLNGTGVGNAIIIIPSCHAVSPHYHPNSTESNIVIEGNFQFFVLDTNKQVSSGILESRQIVNYPKGFPHMLFNPFEKEAVIMATQQFSPPGTFFMNEFTFFDDFAAQTGLGQDARTYDTFKENTKRSNQGAKKINVNRALPVRDFESCRRRARNLKVEDLTRSSCPNGVCSASEAPNSD